MTFRASLPAALLLTSVAALGVARAQTAAPAPAPTDYAPAPQPPPPQYAPPQYAPPPQYAAPPPYYAQPPQYPPRLDYEEGDAIPPGYSVRSRIRKGLVVGGAVTFGVLYVLSVLVADTTKGFDSDNLRSLYIPAIGPFIALSKVQGGNGVLILDGIGQTGGLIMLIAGAAFPRHELVRNDILADVHVVPLLGSGLGGLGLAGAF
ncbi:MAG: hypothetical protein NVSMB47_15150 [Polyangiales bacterium]